MFRAVGLTEIDGGGRFGDDVALYLLELIPRALVGRYGIKLHYQFFVDEIVG